MRADWPHLSLALEMDRARGSNAVAADVANMLLDAVGAPAWMNRRVADAARVAVHYMIGHSTAPRYRLCLSTDDSGITVATTDYHEEVLAGPPAWLPVSKSDILQLAGIHPGVDPLLNGSSEESGLRLHRTLDGHTRLGYHTPWPKS